MVLATIIIAIAYLYFTLNVIWGCRKLTSSIPQTPSSAHLHIDVFIPIRNEALNIPQLLRDLQNQSYNKRFVKVYFINDHSSDNSVELLEKACTATAHYNLIHNERKGKKRAILSAFNQSNGDIILLSDADTVHPSTWIESHAQAHTNKNTDLLIGKVQMTNNKKSLWEALQILEYQSIKATSEGLAMLNTPILCSAANLSFKRSSMLNLKQALNLKYSSGDDMFILEYFKKQNKHIQLLQHEGSTVTIHPEPISTFFIQRMRWAGKAIGFTDPQTLIFGSITFMTNLWMVWLFLLFTFDKTNEFELMLFVLNKFILELCILLLSTNNKQRSKIIVYPILFLTYPFYVFSVALLGMIKTLFTRIQTKKNE